MMMLIEELNRPNQKLAKEEKEENKYVNGIIIKNNRYNLIGTINQPSIVHYISCIIINKNKINNLKINKNYFFAGNNRLNEIKLCSTESLLDYSPLIFT